MSSPSALLDDYRAVRDRTERLCEVLSPEDACGQSMPDASPAKWHLAHTSWFFETFILERVYAGYWHYEPAFREMFNSYYQGVGPQYPRPQRGLLTRPSLDDVYAYRDHVDGHMRKILEGDSEVDPAIFPLIRLGLEHEQQHQELLLTDIKHLFSCNPLFPAYQRRSPVESAPVPEQTWHRCAGGVAEVGFEGAGFSFDNEGPRHRVYVEDFELAHRLVTNSEFLEFIDDGGYERPELWLSEGWDGVQAESWNAPLYWQRRDDGWWNFSLTGLRRVEGSEPVCHVSLFEADAFARWAGVRLPSEDEWEVTAAQQTLEGNFMEAECWHPQALRDPALDRPAQLFGDVWEWTASSYAPYPGYSPPAGPVGEYNGKFMSSQMVLRGGSCATPRAHARATYRNFFPPAARWQFSGIRLARDAR